MDREIESGVTSTSDESSWYVTPSEALANGIPYLSMLKPFSSLNVLFAAALTLVTKDSAAAEEGRLII